MVVYLYYLAIRVNTFGYMNVVSWQEKNYSLDLLFFFFFFFFLFPFKFLLRVEK